MRFLYDSQKRDRARELRSFSTEAERDLWYNFLRNLEVRFYRQFVIGSFIPDVYCRKLKLSIELDGTQHFTLDGLAYDKE